MNNNATVCKPPSGLLVTDQISPRLHLASPCCNTQTWASRIFHRLQLDSNWRNILCPALRSNAKRRPRYQTVSRRCPSTLWWLFRIMLLSNMSPPFSHRITHWFATAALRTILPFIARNIPMCFIAAVTNLCIITTLVQRTASFLRAKCLLVILCFLSEHLTAT